MLTLFYWSYILKKVFKLSLLLSCVPFLASPIQANILDDNEGIRDMLGRGVPAACISKARRDLTKDTVKELIIAAAPFYPLTRIFELYPADGANEDMSASAASSSQETNGEKAFFSDCARDPNLFSQFFYAMAAPYFGQDGNPLTPDPTRQGLRIYEVSKTFYNPSRFIRTDIATVKHHQIATYYRSFSGNIDEAINFPYLKQLLEIQYEFPNRTLHRRNLREWQLRMNIRQVAPFIRGQIALEIERDQPLALEYFSRSQQATPKYDFLRIPIDTRLAELYLGVFKNVSKEFNVDLLNEKKGVMLLSGVKTDPVVLLRLAQYYLGFFGHDIKEDKGTSLLIELTRVPLVSHLAYRTWAEYYLGITNPKAFQMDQAQHLLIKSKEHCDGLEALLNSVYVRQGEIALGIYENQDEEQSDGSLTNTEVEESSQKLNVPLAIQLFQKIAPDADFFLYRIFTGYYGKEYIDQKAADILWDNRQVEGDPLFRMKQGIRLYEQGDIDEAVDIFKQYQNSVEVSYYLARIKSNPSYQKHYDINKALDHYTMPFIFDFRDSRARALQVSLKKLENINYAPAPGKLDMAASWLFVNIVKNVQITPQKLRKSGLFVKADKTSSELYVSSHDTRPFDVTLPEDATADTTAPFSSEQSEEERLEEEARYLLQELPSVDNRAPIRCLSDQRLQDLYDEIGSAPKWNQLRKVVKEFGGKIDDQNQTIKFPHSNKVFNFHRPHSGNPTISLQGYWRKLKAMIDHEFDVICKSETDNNEDAASDSR